MKSSKVVIAVLSAFLLIAVVVLIRELNKSINYNKDISFKQERLREAKGAERDLEKLEGELDRAQTDLMNLDKLVPTGEEKPLSFVRVLSSLADKYSLKRLTAICAVDEEDSTEESGKTSLPPVNRGVGPDMFYPGGGVNAPSSQAEKVEIKPLPIELVLEGEYNNFLSFLKAVSALDRLVSIKRIHIERDENTLPMQSIELNLIAYTFSQ